MVEKLRETMRLPFFLKRTPEGTPGLLSSAHHFPFVTENREGQLNIIGPCSISLCDSPVH